MKYVTIVLGVCVLVGVIVWLVGGKNNLLIPGSMLPSPSQELPYLRLTFERLAKREVLDGKIQIGEKIFDGDQFSSYKFFYSTEGKRVSGQINIPMTPKSNKLPTIVMARGYAPKDGYFTGLGTRNAATVYARNGYITVAPDFLGYGESDMEDIDSIGARLYRPVEILDLLSSLPSLPIVDTDNLILWGHSNGGQIMISVAEILGMKNDQSPQGQTLKVRGMIIWAPVSKPFPYSILAFSDEGDDQGKAIRRALYDFESRYDVFGYSIDRYLEHIKIPIILHQGTLDDAVPFWWSDSLNERLEELDKDISYYKYPGADHNMRPSWDSVVARDLQFLKYNL